MLAAEAFYAFASEAVHVVGTDASVLARRCGAVVSTRVVHGDLVRLRVPVVDVVSDVVGELTRAVADRVANCVCTHATAAGIAPAVVECQCAAALACDGACLRRRDARGVGGRAGEAVLHLRAAGVVLLREPGRVVGAFVVALCGGRG